MKIDYVQVSRKQDSRQMDQEAAIARKAYKTICRRARVKCIKVLHASCVVVIGIGEDAMPIHNPNQLDGFNYLHTCKMLKRKDIAGFLVNYAKSGDVVASNGKILVHEGESLESLAIEFDVNWRRIHG